MGIAWGLHGEEKIIYTLCGADVGLPTQGFVEWGAPHTIPTQSAWGGFAWVSETGVSYRWNHFENFKSYISECNKNNVFIFSVDHQNMDIILSETSSK